MINEGVKFILTLKDHMTAKLPKIGASAQSAFSKVNAGARRAQRDIDLTGRSVNTLNRALRMMERRRDLSVNAKDIDDANRKINLLNTRIKQLKTTGSVITPTGGGGMGRGLLGGFGYGRMMLTAGVLGGTAMGIRGIKNAASAGLQGGANLVSFQTIAGEQEGSKLYRDLTKYAQDSIFGNELYKMAQTQLAFGAKAHTVMPDLKMLGDVSMGDRGRFDSLNLAYSQARSAGKLTGQDLLQFVNAGFNPLQEISVSTGKSMAQLRKEMSDGKISFDQVRAAFVQATSAGGKFHKMTERIADTPYGKVENLRGQWDGVMLKAGEAMAPAIGKAIDKYASPLVDFIGKHIVPTANGLMEFAGQFAAPLKDLAQATGKLMQPVADLMTSDEVKELGVSLVNLTTEIGKELKPVLKDVVAVLKPFAGIAAGVIRIVTPNSSNAYNHLQELKRKEFIKSPEGKKEIFDKINAGLAASDTTNLQNVWNTFRYNNSPNAALFGNENLTPKGSTKTAKDVVEAAANNSNAGAYGNSSTDAITSAGAKVINIHLNASPFDIENMNIEAGNSGIGGMDVRRLELLFNDWFGRMLQSAGYATDH